MKGQHGPGFVVRGQVKLAMAYATHGRIIGTFRELVEARQLAEKHQLEGSLSSFPLRIVGKVAEVLEDFGINISKRQ